MRIFSGIQPTGRKHLGNYLGAITGYVAGQQRAAEAGDVAIYCIVDLHATTVPYDPVEMRARVYDTTAVLIASGLDPERCILFRQSDVPEHAELCWLLCAVTAHGELNRMTQFKEKSAAQRELISAGLFLYPVLQAADVLAYRAHEIPVGDDQRQHIELMRNIAERFNTRFGEGLLQVPRHVIPEVGARIMDLQDPTRKMSTSVGGEEGRVYVLEETPDVEKKFKRAVTDSDNEIRHDRAAKPGVSNLLEILAVARGSSIEAAESSMADARGYGDLKLATAAAVNAMLDPVREAHQAIRADEAQLEATLAAGAQKARAIAADTLEDVRAAMGIGPVG